MTDISTLLEAIDNDCYFYIYPISSTIGDN